MVCGGFHCQYQRHPAGRGEQRAGGFRQVLHRLVHGSHRAEYQPHVPGKERRAPDFPGAVLLDCGGCGVPDCAAHRGDHVKIYVISKKIPAFSRDFLFYGECIRV